jgi:RHS repeat-associated protein
MGRRQPATVGHRSAQPHPQRHLRRQRQRREDHRRPRPRHDAGLRRQQPTEVVEDLGRLPHHLRIRRRQPPVGRSLPGSRAHHLHLRRRRRGNVTGADPAKYTWKYGYDAAGNPASVTDPLGHQRKTGYDAVGNIASVTDARDKQTVYEYDELNRPKKVTAPDTGATAFTYNKAGFLETSTDANTHTSTYGYNDEGQLTSVKNPLGKTVAYEYDLDGNRTKYTNARTQTIITTVDARNLPTKITYSDGTAAQTYGYDDASRLKTVTDATGSRTLSYDDDDKIQTITSPGATKPFTYVWNTDDTLKSRAYPDGRTTSYGYDKVGRTKTQTTNSKAVSYGYDKAGNLTSLTLPTTTARTETRTYDEAGRLTTLTSPTISNTFTYDENDRLVGDKPGTGYPTRYAYDDTGRMTRVCTDTSAASCLTGTAGTTYTYDKVGNLKTAASSGSTTTHTYDDGDQLQSTTNGTTTTSYGYDADGNQTKDDDGTYAYDPAGRLKSATIGTNTYGFTYDADGNRTTVNKNNALAGTSRWDINNPLPQLATDTDASGALLADYHYDPDGTARSMDRTAGTYYFTQDRQNSTSAVYDAAGTDNYRYTYSAWGSPTGKATITGGQTSPFGYTGQYKDQYLPDRLQLRARSYDTAQRRFTTQDPIPADADNPNQSPYNYADNDPTNLSDPTGQCPMCIGAGIGAIVNGGVYAYTHQDDFDWGDFAATTAQGAAVGAIGGFLAPAGGALATQLGLSGGRALAVTVATDATIGAGLTWAINTAQCQPTSPTDLLVGAVTGGLGSMIRPAWGAFKGRFGKPAVTVPPRFGPGAAHSEDPSLLPKGDDEIPPVLHHYTNEAGHDGILASQELRPSTQAANPNDAKFGDGQYLTDIEPGTKRPGQLSAAFYRVPWLGKKVSHYISIDVRGLGVRKGRPGVFYILNDEPLDLTGRIVGSGRN